MKTGLNGLGRGLNVDCAPDSENDGGGALARGELNGLGEAPNVGCAVPEEDGGWNQSSGKPSSVFHGSNGMGSTGFGHEKRLPGRGALGGVRFVGLCLFAVTSAPGLEPGPPVPAQAGIVTCSGSWNGPRSSPGLAGDSPDSRTRAGSVFVVT